MTEDMADDMTESRTIAATLSSLRLSKAIALAASLVTFLVLAISFGWRWPPFQQFIAGLIFYIAYTWHRRLSQRMAEFEASTTRS